MSVGVTKRALEHSEATGVARLVLLCLCWHADDKGVAWPGRETIMQWANASESAVKNGIRTLVKSGEVELLKQGGGRSRSNLYLVAIGVETTDTGFIKPGTINPVSDDTGQNKPGISEETGQILPEKGAEYAPETSKNRHLVVGGGARETVDASTDNSTYREHLLSACGVDPVSGLTGYGSAQLGKSDQMIEANRWLTDLGLTERDVLTEVANIIARKRDGPPSSLKFFTPAMQRLAANLNEARSKPIAPTELRSIPGGRHDRATARDQRTAAVDELIRRVGSGEIHRGSDPSDPFARK